MRLQAKNHRKAAYKKQDYMKQNNKDIPFSTLPFLPPRPVSAWPYVSSYWPAGKGTAENHTIHKHRQTIATAHGSPVL